MKSRRLERIPLKYRKEIEPELRALVGSLQRRREKLGLTQEAFAELLDISVKTLQFIEQGRRFPSLPMLFYIAKHLRLTVSTKEVD